MVFRRRYYRWPPTTVIHDLSKIIPALSKIGLNINPSKCELINICCDQDVFFEASESNKRILSTIRHVNTNEVDFLGLFSPTPYATHCPSNMNNLCRCRINSYLLDAHLAFFLLSKCSSSTQAFVFTPKLPLLRAFRFVDLHRLNSQKIYPRHLQY